MQSNIKLRSLQMLTMYNLLNRESAAIRSKENVYITIIKQLTLLFVIIALQMTLY